MTAIPLVFVSVRSKSLSAVGYLYADNVYTGYLPFLPYVGCEDIFE